MIKNLLTVLGVVIPILSNAQPYSKFIVVDQFGYLPEAKKTAIIKNPQVGFDAVESFLPGEFYNVVDAKTNEKVYRAKITQWNNGATDGSSGDKVWYFDFSTITKPGKYFILDEKNNVKSFEFEIAHNIYNEILKQAMRTFFYQRGGYKKEAQYAGIGWADSASHVGNLQDKNCRSFFDKNNAETEKDVSGGWYDAGDFNKYTNWTANYVVEFIKAYLEKPSAWADDYNIPESGNGIPDILDEAIWGIDHLLRMQQADGSVLSIVGEAHASPPSAATAPSYYGPVSTSATLNTAGALAISSKVYRSIGMIDYADTLLSRAELAWSWADANPDVIFRNNDQSYNSIGLGAGQQEVDDYGHAMAKLEAACFLFEATGDNVYQQYFDANYQSANMMQWNFVFPYQSENQETLIYYANLENATASVASNIKNVYKNAMNGNDINFPAYNSNRDPYFAFLDSYTWGSNNTKTKKGSSFYNLLSYNIDSTLEDKIIDAASGYIHYIHGVNPLNMVYMSNMYNFGGENCVNEFYHSWFTNNSPKWDRVGESTYGPAPGFITGGANPSYDWDGCCPSNCGSSSSNSVCTSESISPPKDQPTQKSYKDFNTSWPLNSWSVTENSCGYQVSYIRLLSKFVEAGMDCNGDIDGGAFIDSCCVCSGGNTGITPSLDGSECITDFENDGDTMFVSGRHIYTASGEMVVLRGVNEMFVWSNDKTGDYTLPQIAKTGANCVRLVWTEEAGNKQQLVQLIENCINSKMIAMPECHSATGEWENLDVCVNFWKDDILREGIQRNREWTLLNIGNEVGNGSVTAAQFEEGYTAAIDSLRNWGYTVPIVIDASNWGQDVNIILETWETLLNHDPLKNVIFSVHSYWSDLENYNKVVTNSINQQLPIIIGEGPSPTAYPVCEILDFEKGLDAMGRTDVGWLAWSWGRMSNGHCVPNFDCTINGEFGNWETIHAEKMMVEHEFSLMKTSQRPNSIFDNDTVAVSGIYISSPTSELFVGDSIFYDVIIAPSNADIKDYTIEISGDANAVILNEQENKIIGVQEGIVTLKAVSTENNAMSFSKDIEVKNVDVTEINITPSEIELTEGDTTFISVEVLPENATNNNYLYEITNDTIIIFDKETGRIIAISEGTTAIKAKWEDGDVEGAVTINISPLVGIKTSQLENKFKIYPNPNEGEIYVTSKISSPYQFSITDLNGRIIMQKLLLSNSMVNAGNLSAGYYNVIIETKDGVLRYKLLLH